jgi:NAD(P)-dependent dehydrogenase (short-subunit alcohol dehydrogenase family)
MARDLHGLNVLVTGANRGLGAAFVERLLHHGASRVLACIRDPDELPVSTLGWDTRVSVVRLDVTDRGQIAKVAAENSNVDLVINNAGLPCVMPFSQGSDALYRQVMDVNFHGPANVTAAFLEGVRERRGGFIYVLSMAALMPGKVAPVYGASKAACEMMALGVRSELAADGVGVTLVYPGFVATRMSETFEFPKTSPAVVAGRALDGWCRNECRVFPDPYAQIARQHLVADMSLLLDDPEAFRSAVFGDFLEAAQPD